MNSRQFKEDMDYLSLKREWGFTNENVIIRIFQLSREYDRIREALGSMKEFQEIVENQGIDGVTRENNPVSAIFDLGRALDVYEYNFPQLMEREWFIGFHGDVGHAHWRAQEGRFNDAHQDEDVLHSLMYEVDAIVKNTSESGHQGIVSTLYEFLENRWAPFLGVYPSDEYYHDVYEARDLYCLGYYSTALLSLGRAVERALLDLGKVRKIESVYAYNRSIDWKDAKFSQRNIALHRANMPGKHGKVLKDPEFHQISILVDYRNKVAHTEYETVDEGRASRLIDDAVDLLKALEEKRQYLSSIEDPIESISDQKVQ